VIAALPVPQGLRRGALQPPLPPHCTGVDCQGCGETAPHPEARPAHRRSAGSPIFAIALVVVGGGLACWRREKAERVRRAAARPRRVHQLSAVSQHRGRAARVLLARRPLPSLACARGGLSTARPEDASAGFHAAAVDAAGPFREAWAQSAHEARGGLFEAAFRGIARGDKGHTAAECVGGAGAACVRCRSARKAAAARQGARRRGHSRSRRALSAAHLSSHHHPSDLSLPLSVHPLAQRCRVSSRCAYALEQARHTPSAALVPLEAAPRAAHPRSLRSGLSFSP
jgi:hypothetical protein